MDKNVLAIFNEWGKNMGKSQSRTAAYHKKS